MQAGLTLSSLTDSTHIHQAIPALTNQLLHHDDFDIRWRMAQGLGKIRDERTVKSLIQALNDPSFYPRDEAAWSLARLGMIAAPALLKTVNQLSPDATIFAALALGRSGVEEAELVAVDLILEHLRASDLSHLCHTVYFAGEIVHVASAYRLVEPLNILLATKRHERLEIICCWALGELGQHWEKLVDWNSIHAHAALSNSVLTRFEAVIALGKRAVLLADPELLLPVVERLADSASRVRFGVMQSVRRYLELVPGMPDLSQLGRILDWHDNDNGVNFEQSLIRDLITWVD